MSALPQPATTPPPPTAQARLVRRLESLTPLTDDERATLATLSMELRNIPADTDIVAEGDFPRACMLISEGFACRYKTLSNGQRQIMNFHIAGDVPDLQSLYLRRMDHSIGALTPVTVASIDHAAMFALIARHPRLGSLFWRDTLIDSAIFREWLLNVGQRPAMERVAHLLCELHLRMATIGLADADSLALPVTQAELADATGLSNVHVNRVLQELKRRGMIGGQGRMIAIPDGPGLRRLAGFDPKYLYLRELPSWWT